MQICWAFVSSLRYEIIEDIVDDKVDENKINHQEKLEIKKSFDFNLNVIYFLEELFLLKSVRN
mgnify:CR=1 FL=1